MKNILFLLMVIFSLTTCKENEVEKPKIGEGIEIYRTKVIWDKSAVKIISAELLNEMPVASYQDIISYSFEFKVPVIYFNKPALQIITKKPVSPRSSDTLYAITINKEIIFNSFICSCGAVDDKGVHFITHNEWNYYYQPKLPDNALVVEWDSLNRGFYPPVLRNLPDPRYDERLLDRLRKDGKLKGF